MLVGEIANIPPIPSGEVANADGVCAEIGLKSKPRSTSAPQNRKRHKETSEQNIKAKHQRQNIKGRSDNG